MSHYEDNANVEWDLGLKLDNREMALKQLKHELFAKAMSTLFDLGEDDVDGVGGQVSFSNFRPLCHDGKDTFAAARRGGDDFIFHPRWAWLNCLAQYIYPSGVSQDKWTF